MCGNTTIPKIFRPITRNTLYFLFDLIQNVLIACDQKPSLTLYKLRRLLTLLQTE